MCSNTDEPPINASDDALSRLLARLSLEQKVQLLTGRDAWTLHAIQEIGLASIVMSDGPAGVRGPRWDERSPSINFPSPTCLAASWDPGIVRAVGEALGNEARRKGVHVLLAPTINLQRTPYGGRHFEAFSEDPVLTAELATKFVAGVQSRGVAATAKHYVVNDSETERFTADVRVAERTLRELYLLAFEEPVRAGHSWLVMSAYNSINGTTATEHALLDEPLNGEWNFDGVVVSDWTAVRSLESARGAQDLAMPGPNSPWGPALGAAVRDGVIAEAVIDRKVLRILRLANRVGALGEPTDRAPAPIRPDLGTAADAAAAGMVLLSNKSLLPLRPSQRLSVIGEGARTVRTQGGGSATVIPTRVAAPLDAMTELWPAGTVRWSRGAVLQQGLADLPVEAFEAGAGEPGMRVRYLDGDGEVITTEIRTASRIVSFDAEALISRAASVEFSFRYRPERIVDGQFDFGVVGVADYRVGVDGTQTHEGSLRLAPGADPAAAAFNPPFTAMTLPISGGVADLIVTFAPAGANGPVPLALGVGIPPMAAGPDELIAEAAASARSADAAVVFVGTSPEVESEGFDRTSLALPGRQDDLVRAVAAANPHTVVVVNAGAPVLLPWRDDVAAILIAWFPGQEFAPVLADVLAGIREPGGRLPVTWPDEEANVPVSQVAPTGGRLAYREGLHIGYRAWLKAGKTPAYPFGHGLGYTDWSIEALHADDMIAIGSQVEVSVDVVNVGNRRGKAVIQLYLERADPSIVERPARWLVGFATGHAEPGATIPLVASLDWRRFAHWDDRWELEPGAYRLWVGLSATDLKLSTRVVANGRHSQPSAARQETILTRRTPG